jgi:hypothetical protein
VGADLHPPIFSRRMPPRRHFAGKPGRAEVS